MPSKGFVHDRAYSVIRLLRATGAWSVAGDLIRSELRDAVPLWELAVEAGSAAGVADADLDEFLRAGLLARGRYAGAGWLGPVPEFIRAVASVRVAELLGGSSSQFDGVVEVVDAAGAYFDSFGISLLPAGEREPEALFCLLQELLARAAGRGCCHLCTLQALLGVFAGDVDPLPAWFVKRIDGGGPRGTFVTPAHKGIRDAALGREGAGASVYGWGTGWIDAGYLWDQMHPSVRSR